MDKLPETQLVPGTPFAGGFFAGHLFINNELHALIVAPKAEGEHADIVWNDSWEGVLGAQSFFDGLSNTKAMAEAGSKLAQWTLALRIADCSDWYLPSQDELEILYRNLKPTTRQNCLYGRSGINVSAAPPTYPYTKDAPMQTAATIFQRAGEQSFEEDWYWSSTQHASDAAYAWNQDFNDGTQDYDHKSYEGRARAVRRLKI